MSRWMGETKGEVEFTVDGHSFGPWPGFGQMIERCVMPLWTVIEGRYRHAGTGFIINGGGLMMTAKHVLEGAARHTVRKINAQGDYYDHWELYAVYTSDERHDHGPDSEASIGGPICIVDIATGGNLDIALCWLAGMQNTKTSSFLTFPAVGLSARLPEVGEHVLGCGYYGDIETKLEGDCKIVEWDRKKAMTAGVVIEVFPNGRDSSMLPFPCFRLDTRFEGGMSGGPIFGEDGFVCGVICSGAPPTGEDSTYLAYGASVRPSFGIPMRAIIAPSTEPENLYLYEYAKKGFVKTDESFSKIRFNR